MRGEGRTGSIERLGGGMLITSRDRRAIRTRLDYQTGKVLGKPPIQGPGPVPDFPTVRDVIWKRRIISHYRGETCSVRGPSPSQGPLMPTSDSDSSCGTTLLLTTRHNSLMH